MCTRIYRWHYLSPLVPSVLSRVGAEMGPTFWKLQKCAAFRQMHRYRLHFALVVALSFCFENGAPAAKWKMGGLWREASLPPTLGVVVKHDREQRSSFTMQPWASRVWGPFTSVFVAWDRFEVTMEASSEWLWR